jgi:hypothetical protein
MTKRRKEVDGEEEKKEFVGRRAETEERQTFPEWSQEPWHLHPSPLPPFSP